MSDDWYKNTSPRSEGYHQNETEAEEPPGGESPSQEISKISGNPYQIGPPMPIPYIYPAKVSVRK